MLGLCSGDAMTSASAPAIAPAASPPAVGCLPRALTEASRGCRGGATAGRYRHPALSTSASHDLVALGTSAELGRSPGPVSLRWPERAHVLAVSVTAVGATVTLAVVAAALAGLGAARPTRLFVLLGLGAIAAQAWPRARRAIALVAGVAALVTLNPVFGAVFSGMVGLLALCRRRVWPFVAVLVAGAIVLPKMAFSRHYQDAGYWNWINEPSLALALFASGLWWRARATRRAGGAAPADDALSFLLLYFLPGQAAFPMVFSPGVLERHEHRSVAQPLDLRALATPLGWFVTKAVALMLLPRCAPHGFLRQLAASDLAGLGVGDLWLMVVTSYVELYLTLALTADVPVLLARLYGWPVPAPFRAALLAWNPVELWRRWGLYNRALLLQLVYFPLGGGERHRYRNVMLTFLASALLLHSGWFGSKYWEVGPGGWRDETLYFLLQGLAVCASLRLLPQGSSQGARASSPRRAWRSWGRPLGIVATQGWSALVHVIVLAQGIDLGTRGRVIARCLGL